MANHLTFDEMLKYVTIDKLDNESLLFIAEKNIHLKECKECAERIDKLQALCDELLPEEISLLGDLEKEEELLR